MSNRIWSIGADEPLQAVLDSADCREGRCPAILRQTLTGYLSWQERNRVTVRQTVGSPRIAPQWVAALMAAGATVSVEGDPAQEFPLAEWQPKKGRIAALHVPLGDVRLGEAHVGRTPADEPIVAAIAGVEMDGDRVAAARLFLTGVGPAPIWTAQAADRLRGRPLDETSIQAVAAAVEQEVAPQGDFRGSAEYRRAMAGVLTRRALLACLPQEVRA